MALLTVDGITKRFGGLVAVDNLSLTVEEGEIVGLIGPNGAGKTTAFNLISGTDKPDTGRVTLAGEDITRLRPDQICKLGLTRTFQVVKPFRQIPVLANVKIGAYSRTDDSDLAAEKAEKVLKYLDMWNIRNEMAASLPIAARKRLELARALATEPKMLLLDEVMGGLRPTEVNDMIQVVDQLRKNGITILMVEHVMKAIMSLADRIAVLHHGEKIAEGTPQEISQNKTVIDAYLGKAMTNVKS